MLPADALFVVSAIAWQIFQPSSLLVIALVIGVVLTIFRRGPLGLGLLIVATLGLSFAWLFPIGQYAMKTLEERYPPVNEFPQRVDGIIVLGGAVIPRVTERWGLPALTDGAERMTAFVGLARRYPSARLVFAGGGGRRGVGHLREADLARQLFADLGLDVSKVTFERESLNTWQNAVFSHDLVKPEPGQVWLLVTSAFHMPRAMGAFRKAGWNVLPWPVGFKSGDLSFQPGGGDLPRELHLLDYAAHEWVGLIAYSAMGRLAD